MSVDRLFFGQHPAMPWKNNTGVVNIKKHESYDVYIGRGSPFGNPYKSGSRDENCDHYEIHFHNRIKNNSHFKRLVLELDGKTLGCFCKPKRCHGDTIVKYLEEYYK